MRFAFRVYEIEHDGDLDNASEAIRKAGGTVREVGGIDFEHGETAAFLVEIEGDDRVAFMAAVAAAGVCL